MSNWSQANSFDFFFAIIESINWNQKHVKGVQYNDKETSYEGLTQDCSNSFAN